MSRQVEVLIIGAGTAGLAAAREVARRTERYLVVDHGPLGTLCARAGCMPSKVLIRLAQDAYGARRLVKDGLDRRPSPQLDTAAVLTKVRAYRDGFTDHVIASLRRQLGDHLIKAAARFTGPNRVELDDGTCIEAKRCILAVGSEPEVPAAWAALRPWLITSDDVFDRPDLPRRIAVLGLGAVGVELGQALARLGLEVHAYGQSGAIAGLSDPEVTAAALAALREDMSVTTHAKVSLERAEQGVVVIADGQRREVDLVLAAAGRKPALADLQLERSGATLAADGQPQVDRRTLKVAGAPLFMAGDAGDLHPLLHEAAIDGEIAGRNAVAAEPKAAERPQPLRIAFSRPNIAVIGRRYSELTLPDIVIGATDYTKQGRAKVMGEAQGCLRLYAERDGGRLVGAELAAPEGEHLAHLLAWAIEAKQSVDDLLKRPYYHPTVEEGLRDALREASAALS